MIDKNVNEFWPITITEAETLARRLKSDFDLFYIELSFKDQMVKLSMANKYGATVAYDMNMDGELAEPDDVYTALYDLIIDTYQEQVRRFTYVHLSDKTEVKIHV